MDRVERPQPYLWGCLQEQPRRPLGDRLGEGHQRVAARVCHKQPEERVALRGGERPFSRAAGQR
jgi:hypothetical protein